MNFIVELFEVWEVLLVTFVTVGGAILHQVRSRKQERERVIKERQEALDKVDSMLSDLGRSLEEQTRAFRQHEQEMRETVKSIIDKANTQKEDSILLSANMQNLSHRVDDLSRRVEFIVEKLCEGRSSGSSE